ncbi:MAG: VWA domain-containing protein [Candidatus Hydrogenedentes bacterium]|nr:VWA domain-containing protein [Candidatus Hydrogenedentota bacterium]
MLRMTVCVTLLLVLIGVAGCPAPNPVGGPVLSALPLAFSFDADDTSKVISISNAGEGILVWATTNAPAWLTVAPPSGTGPAVATLTVDRTGLAPGTYSEEFILASNGGSFTVPVVLTVEAEPLPPTLGVSPAELDFGETTLSLPFQVSNLGDGTLNWSAAADDAWILGVSPTTGSVESDSPDTVTVTVARTGLTPGSYVGSVTVTNTDTSDTETVTVLMEVPGPSAELAVSPATLDFGTTTTQLNIVIGNTGTAALDWTLTDDMAWLAASATSGTLAPGAQTVVTATVTRDAVTTPPASSPFSGTITVTEDATGDYREVAVEMEVRDTELVVNPLTLNFGSYATSKLLAIQNGGLGTVNWSIDTSSLPEWLEDDVGVALISPTSGSVTTDAEGVLIQVNRTPGGGPRMAAGNYTYDLVVTSDAGSATVTINMTVAVTPVLQVDTGAVDLEGQPILGVEDDETTAQFTISNAGTGTLNWQIDSANFPSWLTMNPVAGAISTQVSTITVMVNRTGLEAGGYSHVATVTSNGGTQTVEFTMQVPLTPEIAATPTAIDLGLAGDTGMFWVANVGDVGTSLYFIVESDRDWLYVSPANGISFGVQGSWEEKDWQRINIAIDRGGLNSSGATGTLTVSAVTPAGDPIPDIEPRYVTVSVQAAPLSFETTIARKRIPSILRFVFIMRDLRDDTFVIAPEAVAHPFTMYEKDTPVEEPAETTLTILAQNSLLTEALTTQRTNLKVNTVLLLDYSGSMEASAQEIGRTIQDVYEEVGEAFIDEYFAVFANVERGSARMAIMEYHARDVAATLRQDFTDDAATLKTALQGINITDNGASAILPATESASLTLQGEDGSLVPFEDADVRAVVLVSDGRLTTPPGEVQDTVDILLGAKTRTFNVGWGLDLNSEPLARLATRSGGHYYPTRLDGSGLPDVSELTDGLTTVASDLGSHMVLSYVALNEEESVAVRFDGAFDDPNDVPDQGLIEGSLDEQNLNLLEIIGDIKLGQISMRSPGELGGEADVTLRAEYLPRNVNKFEFVLASTEAFTVAQVPEADGGLVADWTMVLTPSGGGPYNSVTVSLTSPGDVLPYGTFGDLIRLHFATVGTVPFDVLLTVDNTIYAVDAEPKYFIAPDSFTVETTLECAPAFPALDLDPTMIAFGSATDTATIDLRNIGGSYTYPLTAVPWYMPVRLEWEVVEEPAFVNVSPDSGYRDTAIGAQTLTVTANRTVEPGDYMNFIVFAWDAGSVAIAGSTTVLTTITVLPPVLAVSTNTVAIPNPDTSGTFDITNTGQSTLTWSIDTSALASWITSVTPTSGTTTSETDTVGIYIDRTGLSTGTYTDTFDVVSDGGTETITVQLAVP